MENIFIFIYAKEKEIKVLNNTDAIKQKDELILDGWKHTCTLDPCIWIGYLHNVCEAVDLYDEVSSLSRQQK